MQASRWGGSTHYVVRIDPRGADRPGADRPWGGLTGTLIRNGNRLTLCVVLKFNVFQTISVSQLYERT